MDAAFIFAAKYLILFSIVILGAFFFVQPWPAQKRMALFAIPAGLLAYALGLLGNHVYFDPRPFVVGHFIPLVAHAPDNGFPSDHTLLAAALAAVGMLWNRWLGVALWVIAIVIAIARVYVGVHHAVDVIGSIVIACLAVLLAYAAYTRFWHKRIR